jgi:hypothetical protein
MGIRSVVDFVDKDSVRRTLPLPYLCFELGLPLDESGRCRCPFHDDTNPSFRTWVDEYDVPRWGCFPCGAKGDAYDLIQRVESCGFTDSLLRARALLESMPAVWEGTGAETRREFDRATAEELVDDARVRARDNLGWLCVAVGVVDRDADPAYREAADVFLIAVWRVGLDTAGNTVIPHYDYSGQLSGVKFRELGGGDRWAMPGSRFDCLYGGWSPRQHRDVVLCEGESDCWWASLQSPAADVLALPSGAGLFLPQWLTLEADTLVLAFDGDDAGRAATAVWQHTILQDGRQRTVVLEPPDGHDLRSWRPDLPNFVQECCKVVP